MTEFLLKLTKLKPVKVNKNQVFFMCFFRLPEAVKESLTFSDTSQIEGNVLMGFYCAPNKGDLVTYKNFTWRVEGKHHYPTRRGSREEKVIAELILEYIGEIGM